MKVREHNHHGIVSTCPFNDVRVFSPRHPNFTDMTAIKPGGPEQGGGVSWHSLIE
jgi:hypothetical protein